MATVTLMEVEAVVVTEGRDSAEGVTDADWDGEGRHGKVFVMMLVPGRCWCSLRLP